MTGTLGFDQFAVQKGTSFRVAQVAGRPVDLVLDEVVQRNGDPRFEEFSLFFTGPLQPPLPQGTYGMTHSALGEQAIFITPVALDPEGYRYQAVFNRIQEPLP